MLIAQLSDCHLGCGPDFLEGRMDTHAALQRAVAHVRSMQPAPDVVLLTGDLTDRGAEADYADLRAAMAPLQQPVYAIPGNHDLPSVARRALPESMPLDTDAPTGRVCYAVRHGDLVLIGLDTVVVGHSHGELGADQLAWLARTLQRHRQDPVLIFMHHPPLRTGIEAMDACGLLQGREALAEQVRAHGAVQGILCGHVHRAIGGMLGGVRVQVAPSTAHQVELDLRPGAPLACRLEPPQVALHHWSPQDGLCTHLSPIDRFPGPFPL